MAVEQLFTNTAYRTGSGTAPRSGVGVERGFGGMVGGCVAVGWRMWLTWLVFGLMFMGGVAVVWRVWVTWLVFVMELRCRFSS